MKAGLLMETTQSQQRLIAASLKQLKNHTQELDTVVREQIQRTLTEEFGALVEESAQVLRNLRALQKSAGRQFASWTVAVTASLSLLTLLSAWWLLPSPSQINALRLRQEQLTAVIDNLEQRGARIDLRRCGNSGRWCVRVDRQAPTYGEQSDYYVLKGY
jgi:hypothetical protein